MDTYFDHLDASSEMELSPVREISAVDEETVRKVANLSIRSAVENEERLLRGIEITWDVPEPALLGEQLTTEQGAIPFTLAHPSDSMTITIGRSKANAGSEETTATAVPMEDSIMFYCRVVSKTHAKVEIRNNKVFIFDTGSHHGTWRDMPSTEGCSIGAFMPVEVRDGETFVSGKSLRRNGKQYRPASAKITFIHFDSTPPMPTQERAKL